MDLLDSTFSIFPDCQIVFAGDFNADPGSSSTTPNEQGKIMLRFLTRWSYLSLHLTLPHSGPDFTYESEAHSSVSVLDHILCSDSFLPCVQSCGIMSNHPLNLSDHYAVFASISISTSPAYNTVSSSNSSHRSSPSNLAWSKVDDLTISSYTRDVELHLSLISLEISSTDDIDRIVSSLTDILIKAGKSHIPSYSPKPHIRSKWPQSVRDAHSLSKQLYKNWVSAGKPYEASHPLKRAYKEAKRVFRKELRVLNREELEDFYQSLDPSDPKIFKLIRQKLGGNAPPTDTIMMNGTTYVDNGIPDGWAAYFQSLYTPSTSYHDPNHHFYISEEVQKILHSPVETLPEAIIFTPEDVTSVILSLPKNKASGPDCLSMEHLIYAPISTLSIILAKLFSAILELHYVPKSFCSSTILPLFKGGSKNPTDPGSYRGISLSSNLSKVFEHTLMPLLSADLLPSIHPLQGGFRPGFSTFHTSFILNEATSECKTSHSIAFQAFLDVKKAFDTVWHDGLFFKLNRLHIHSDIWFTMYNWYSRLSASVLWCSFLSKSFPVLQGVRQGAVLSPILYSVFTSDLLYDLEHSNLGASIESIYCGAPTYADDMALVAKSPSELQGMLDIVTNYANIWEYSINPTKSEIIINCNKPSVRSALPKDIHWHVCGCDIPIVESTKHLGILVSSSKSTINRTTDRITSSRSAFYAISSVGARHSCINPLTSLQFYKTLCLPILSFGLEIWSPTTTEIRMMEKSQLKILRTILGLPSRTSSVGIHLLLGTIPIEYLAQLKLLSFVRSVVNLPSSSIPTQIMALRADQRCPPTRSIIHRLISSLGTLCLPSLQDLMANPPSNRAWKALTKTMIHEMFREVSLNPNTPPSLIDLVRNPPPKYGHPMDILLISKHNLRLARLSSLRIRLLLHVSSLRAHTCSFRLSDRFPARSDDCLLCHSNDKEDLAHFISVCPALQPVREMWLPRIYHNVDIPDPDEIVDHVLGVSGLASVDQLMALRFLADLYAYRYTLLFA